MDTARFLAHLPMGERTGYPGRANLLGEPKFQELWLHLTDRCNMACKHCLFAASPKAGTHLPTEAVRERVREALEMGCRDFALTGGEPFLHPRISEKARKEPGLVFTTLYHHISDVDNLRACYDTLKSGKAMEFGLPSPPWMS